MCVHVLTHSCVVCVHVVLPQYQTGLDTHIKWQVLCILAPTLKDSKVVLLYIVIFTKFLIAEKSGLLLDLDRSKSGFFFGSIL